MECCISKQRQHSSSQLLQIAKFFKQSTSISCMMKEELLNRTSCEVHTFDPTLSKETEAAMLAALPELNFHAIGVGRGSGSGETLEDGGFYSIEQVMGNLAHAWVDVLKIDIENHEWDVFGDFYATPGARLPATQLLVEFHWPGNADRVWKV